MRNRSLLPATKDSVLGSPPSANLPGKTVLLKILMLEDDIHDAELIQMALKSHAVDLDTTLVSSKEEYIEALESKNFDVILSDHNLPQFSSLEALRIRNQLKLNVPVILVSGAIPEEHAVMILQEGANDYILKDRPQRLMSAITEAIKKQNTFNAKLQAEQELFRVNERLRLVGKATADAIRDWNLITDEVYWSEGVEILFGYKLIEIRTDINSWVHKIHWNDRIRITKSITKLVNGASFNWSEEYQFMKADGTYAIVLDKGIVIRDENGKAYRMVSAMQDITHIRRLELDLLEQDLSHQKQKTDIALKSQEQERIYII